MIYIWGDADRWENYRRAVESAGGRVRFSMAAEDLDICRGLLLTGGGDLEPWRYGQEDIACRGADPARDAAEMALLDRAVAGGKPVLGICRGLQSIDVYFGGTLCQDLPGHGAVEGRDRLHPVRTAPSFLRDLYGEAGEVNSAHHQAADRLGRGLQAVQWAPDGVVEGICHRSLPVWGVQWHPERRAGGERLFRAFLELCRSGGKI